MFTSEKPRYACGDEVEVRNDEHGRSQDTDVKHGLAANPVGEVPDERNENDRGEVPEHGDPQEGVRCHTDAVRLAGSECEAEDEGGDGNAIRQRHAEDP